MTFLFSWTQPLLGLHFQAMLFPRVFVCIEHFVCIQRSDRSPLFGLGVLFVLLSGFHSILHDSIHRIKKYRLEAIVTNRQHIY